MNVQQIGTSYLESLEVLHERVGAFINANPGLGDQSWGSLLFAYTETKNQQKKHGGRVSKATIISDCSAPEHLRNYPGLAAGENDETTSS